MLTRGDLFPREPQTDPGLTLQGRILLRVSGGKLLPQDVHSLTKRGSLSARDNPDQAHGVAVYGW